MDKVLFDKLNRNVWELELDTKAAGILNRANVSRVIQIYWLQEKHGGYSRKLQKGLRRLVGLGSHTLWHVEQHLDGFGFPALSNGAQVVAEYDDFAKSCDPSVQPSAPKEEKPISDQLIRTILTGTLRAIGKKHDPTTIDRVIKIVS